MKHSSVSRPKVNGFFLGGICFDYKKQPTTTINKQNTYIYYIFKRQKIWLPYLLDCNTLFKKNYTIYHCVSRFRVIILLQKTRSRVSMVLKKMYEMLVALAEVSITLAPVEVNYSECLDI